MCYNPVMQNFSESRRRFLMGTTAACLAPALPAFADSPLELSAGVSAHALRGASFPPVPLWTFNRQSPGPLLRGRRGDALQIRLANNLPDAATSVHWHGVRVDNKMDGAAGVTQEAVPPGEIFDYEVRLPDAGTFWYHSHNRSWEQVARGLYGPLIVDDPDAPPTDADLLLILDDWKLARNGDALDAASFGALGEWSHGGRMGNWLTVNSRPQPVYEVPAGGRIRLRLISAANARIMRTALPEALRARIVALDGRDIAPRDFPADGVLLSPAQRMDVVSDLPATAGDYPLRILFGRGRDFAAATLRTVPGGKKLVEKTEWPSPPKVVPPEMENAARGVVHMMGGAMGGMRGAMMGGEGGAGGKMIPMRELARMKKLWAFNGRVGSEDYELLRLRPGRTGILRVENETAWPHAMHLHGHHFIPLPVGSGGSGGTDGSGGTGGTGEGGGNDLVWRDTHLLGRNEVSEYVFVGGAPGKWLFHCHMLEHHAAGMAGIVTVA